jgi:hypothetical protein
MGRVSVYTPQLEIPVVNAPMVRPNQVGLAVADGVEQVAHAWDQKAKADASTYVAKKTSELRLKYARMVEEDNLNGIVSDGYTGQVLDQLETDHKGISEEAPNRYAREMWDLSFADVIASVENDARNYETRAIISNRATDLETTFRNNGHIAVMPNTTIDTVHKLAEENHAAALSARLPTDLRNKYVQESASIYEAFARSKIESDPQGLINLIEKGAFPKEVNPEKLPIWLDQARNQLLHKQNVNDAALNREARDVLEKVRGASAKIVSLGVPLADVVASDPSISQENLERLGLGKEWRELALNEKGRSLRKEMEKAPPPRRAAIQKEIMDLAKGTELETAPTAVEEAKLIGKQAAEDQKELETDPYSAIYKSEDYAIADQKFIEEFSTGQLTPDQIGAHRRKLMDLAVKAQRENRIAEVNIKAVSRRDEDILKNEWQDAKGEERFALLAKWKSQFGPTHMKYLKRQLRTVLSPDPKQAAAFLLDENNPGAAAVAATLDTPANVIDSKTNGVGDEVVASIAETVKNDERMNYYAKSMSGNPANIAHFAQMSALAQHAAKVFVKGGMSQSEAVEKAVSGFMSAYTFVETDAGSGSVVRIPSSRYAAHKLIDRGMVAALRDDKAKLIDWSKTTLVPNATKFDKGFQAELRENGKFLAASNGQGVFLTTANGDQVFINGKPAFLSFDSLTALGSVGRDDDEIRMPKGDFSIKDLKLQSD